MERTRQDFRNTGGIVDFRRPFRHRAENRAIIEFLKGTAFAGRPFDLANEQDHRDRILMGNMHAGTGIGGTGATGDEADAWPAGQPTNRVRHHRCAAFLAADGDADRGIMQRIQHGEIAFARHAEDIGHFLLGQLVNENLGSGARHGQGFQLGSARISALCSPRMGEGRIET